MNSSKNREIIGHLGGFPSSPRHVAFVDVRSQQIYVNDRLAYLASDSNLLILDVSDPVNPVEIGRFDFREECGYTTCLSIKGNLAFVLGSGEGGEGKLQIVDVSLRNKPNRVALLDIDGSCLKVTDSYAFIESHFDGGLIVLDLKNQSSPAQIGRYLASGYVHGMLQTDTTSFAFGWDGVHMIDVSSSDARSVGFWGNRHDVHSVDVVGETMYLAEGPHISTAIAYDGNGGGIRIIDISRHSQPVEVGFLELSRHGTSVDVVVLGETAYVLWTGFRDQARSFSNRIFAVDISEPHSPKLLKVYDIPSESTDYRLPTSDHGSPNTDYRFRLTDYRSPLTDH